MQTQHLPTFDSSYRDLPHLASSAVSSAATPLDLPAIYAEHCAPPTDAAFGRCAGRAMQSLSLPPPSSLPSTPFGRRTEPGSGLAKLPSQFSPGRSEPQSYPSPPMSDSHSPARRSAHIVEPETHPYPHSLNDPRRHEGIVPSQPPPSLLEPRSAVPVQGFPHPRLLYPGESQSGAQPLHYQPARAAESHYGGVQVPQNYAYGYPPPGVPSYLGAPGPVPGPQAQPTAIITPTPIRPSKPARRTKAHVASACVNCKKAHLSCDVQRPCGRCVASGKQETCKDVQHKKRGRPRLRDDKDFGRSEETRTVPSQLVGAPSTSSSEPFTLQSPFAAHRAPDPSRILGSNREEDVVNGRHQHTGSGGPPPRLGSYGGTGASPYPARPNPTYQTLPVAFLNLDLVIHKSNRAFEDLVSFLGDVRGRSLAELLDAQQHEIVHRLRGELREERDDREPTYMAPITPGGQDPLQTVLQTVQDKDVDQVSRGADRSLFLNFRMPNGQHQPLQTQVRLAKTSVYFVTVVVRTPPRTAGPPLLTQQLAPPTPIHASQTRSAPTAAPSREFGPHPGRSSSSASSAPTSPYFNFNSVRTSLPTISSSSYGSSHSYGYSPTAGPDQGYFPTYQPPSQPGAYPSAYQSASRTGSIISEYQRETNSQPARLEGLQLPPIRTAPAPPLASPVGHGFAEGVRDRVRRRESLASTVARPETPDTSKRRRLNIHEVLE